MSRFWLGAAALYLALAVLGTWPVAWHAGGRLPGTGGDAEMNAWNLWYVARVASREEPSIFTTRRLFHPTGTSLHFHTLNLGGALLVLPLLASGAGLAAAYTALWLMTYVLSALGAALLAWRTTSHRGASVVAGLLFAFCPFRTAHGTGHLDLLGTQWLPLFAALGLTCLAPPGAAPPGRRLRDAALAGACFGLASLTSWYFMVDLAILGGLAAVWLATQRSRPPLVPLLVLAVVASALVLPVALPMIGRARAGASYYLPTEHDYPADLLGFLLPPGRSLLGRPLAAAIAGGSGTFTGNAVEGDVALGWTCLALAALGWRRSSSLWKLSAIAFGVLSLGPELTIAAHPTGLPLPAALLSQVPFVKGARVPSRFVIMVSLSLVPPAAAGLARLAERWPRRGLALLSAVAALALVELAPLPYPSTAAAIPAPYAAMGADPQAGAVMDVPHLYLRRNLYLHTAHGRSIAGGWVARVEPSERAAFRAQVEEARDLLWSERDGAGRELRTRLARLSIRYVVLDEPALEKLAPRAATARARLAEAFPEGPWQVDGTHRFYRIDR